MDALKRRLADRRAFAWLDQFTITELTEQRVTLAPRPGQRGMTSLVTDKRRAELADQLKQILGRPVQVRLGEPPEQSAEETGGEASTPASKTGGARQQAMELPLVREVLEQFPNASLTDVRREQPTGDDPPTDADPDPSIS
jgi:hypothetical protein